MEKIDFKKEIENRREELLADITKWIQIPSVTADRAKCKEALKWGLDWAKEAGFETESFDDNQSGHIKFGSDEEFIGVLGHVDVVPVDEKEWDFAPFGGENDGEYIYGRGTQDDKAPLLMTMHALKIIKDLGLPIKKGARIIMGTQEEGGDWSDIEDYFKTNKAPVCGFTPDANFPLIYAEKHILRINANANIELKNVKEITAGNAVNSVPGEAKLVTTFDEAELKKRLEEFRLGVGITFVQNGSEVTFTGAAAHAMECFKGKSALWDLVRFVNTFEDCKELKFLEEKYIGDHYGEKIGIAAEAEDGKLTINIGIMNFKGSKLEIRFDHRVPNSENLDDVEKNIYKVLDSTFEVSTPDKTYGLFKDKNDPLIKTLEKSYRDVTGDDTPLQTTGGGTYAKAAPNTVAFGPLFPTDVPTLHQKNERQLIKSIIDATEIYCIAMYDLMK